MAKVLEPDYQLDDGRMSNDDIRKALSGDLEGFKFFFENCVQLQDKETRQLIHPKMNKGQEMIAEALLRHISKKTRADKHKELVIVSSRQIGKSTLITTIANYISAYVPGMERASLVHTLQTGGAADKYYRQKMEPIITGVRPDIFPTIERNTLGTSTQLLYKNVKGVPRNTFYEILSANSNSVRSGTVTAWLCDEPSEYRNPMATEDAISGAISDYGFSFTAYIGTFSDRLSNYFANKIQTALDNPDEMELIFIPWYFVYGRPEDGVGFSGELTEYDKKVIVPAMQDHGYSQEEIRYKIAWYHRRALRTSNVRAEFPTTIDDVMAMGQNRCYFPIEELNYQEENNVEEGDRFRLVTDNLTGKVEAQRTDVSPFKMFRAPMPGHKYKLVADAITSLSGESDYFAMSVFDDDRMEQVATFYENGLALEDYADYAIAIARLYNNALITPEKNMAESFISIIKSRRYYYFFYENATARGRRDPGIRTTATSKDKMLQNTVLLLQNHKLVIHDKLTIDQMLTYERKVKKRADGSESVRVEARAGHHDDMVSTIFIYVGSLDNNQLSGQNSTDWFVI